MLQEAMDRVEDDWPDECYDEYQRIDVLGKGSFGLVWLAQRKQQKSNKSSSSSRDMKSSNNQDGGDDEYVAIKSIQIKNDKGKVYAEREIQILHELRHPHVIRLLHAYPIHANKSRVVVMELARGPNLHQLVVKRGALGLPIARLVSRQLIGAVSYIHGRAVLHRDIKPSNCILALTNHPTNNNTTTGDGGDDSGNNDGGIADAQLMIKEEYDWFRDDAIWSNHALGRQAVEQNRWKLMLVDFGFARALELNEIESQTKKMRNSIVFETTAVPETAPSPQKTEGAAKSFVPRSMYADLKMLDETEDEDDSIEADMKALENIVIKAADSLRKSFKPVHGSMEGELFSEQRPRHSGVSMMPDAQETVIPITPIKSKKKSIFGGGGKTTTPGNNSSSNRRPTIARHRVRSMSALGTKAYAAPEIRKQLRHKNDQDLEKANAAMTECVADYGMIVDAYSVGWTLRVALTGVLPQFTISEYMDEREGVILEQPGDEDEISRPPEGCCCFATAELPPVRIRDPSILPAAATLLITRLTEKKPEDRMTVREAQLDPWIAGEAADDDPLFTLPQGDVPAGHGDPVVPLRCANELSEMAVSYHTAP